MLTRLLQVVSFQTDSFIYLLDYATGQSSLVQAFATSGASNLLIFNDALGDTYLCVANYRDNSGLSTQSSIYRWKAAANFSKGQSRGCCDSNKGIPGRFVLLQSLQSIGAIGFDYWEKEENSSLTMYLALATEGGTSMSLAAVTVYNFLSQPPAPRPVTLTPSYLGKCDALAIDASSSFGSGGRPFAPQWILSNFSSEQVVATTPSYGLAVKTLIGGSALISSDILQVKSKTDNMHSDTSLKSKMPLFNA